VARRLAEHDTGMDLPPYDEGSITEQDLMDLHQHRAAELIVAVDAISQWRAAQEAAEVDERGHWPGRVTALAADVLAYTANGAPVTHIELDGEERQHTFVRTTLLVPV
jgi:hypothetical protein